MNKNMFFSTRLKVLGLVCIMGLLLVSFPQVFARPSISQLQGRPLALDVPALKQSKSTSCGEAVIAMAYNYANPNQPITEAAVIEYAATNEYYTPNRTPYTRPANMVKIAKYYTKDISTGRVFRSG
jgi:hypothetical protein